MKSDLESLAAPYLDGELDLSGREQLELRLEEAPEDHEEFLELAGQARALDVIVPALLPASEGRKSMIATDEERFTRSVMERLPATPSKPRSRRWPWAVAAAGLLGLAAWLATRPVPPDPPVARPVPAAEPVGPEPVQTARPPDPPPVPPAAVAAPGRPFKLGVVNLTRCFNRSEYRRIQEVDADLQSMAQELTANVKALEQKIAVIQQKLDAIVRTDHPRLWESKRRDLAVAQTQLKFEKELGRARYVSFYNDRKIEVYNEIRKAVSEVAHEDGLDLVLRVEAPFLQASEDGPQPSVMDQINSRVVLYYDTGVDITDSVLEHLNRKWDTRKKDN